MLGKQCSIRYIQKLDKRLRGDYKYLHINLYEVLTKLESSLCLLENLFHIRYFAFKDELTDDEILSYYICKFTISLNHQL